MTPDGLSVIEDIRVDNEELEEQGQLRRALRFICTFFVLYTILLFLNYEHQTILVFLVVGIFVAWILYMLIVIVILGICVKSQDVPEERGLTYDMPDDEEESSSSPSSSSDLLSFDTTPQRIKSVKVQINPGSYPKNGKYEIVYNAVFFGKAIRMQLNLNLEFTKSDNGWYISGESMSSSSSSKANNQERSISEGFVNSLGQMYWIMVDSKNCACIYYGLLDFATNSMFDGEFLTQGNNEARGRIVRLVKMEDDDDEEEETTNWPSTQSTPTSVEMVSLPTTSQIT